MPRLRKKKPIFPRIVLAIAVQAAFIGVSAAQVESEAVRVARVDPLLVPVDASGGVVESIQTAPEPDLYEDQLIDPSQAEDEALDELQRREQAQPLGLRHWSVTAKARSYDASNQSGSDTEQALSLRYTQQTANFGNLALDASIQNGDDQSFLSPNSDDQQVSGAATLYQYYFPISGEWLMDNTLGVYRNSQSYLSRLGYRSYLRNPALRGVSSQLYNLSGHRVSLSVGQLGQYRSSLARGFETTDGQAMSLAYQMPLSQGWSAGGELWQVDERDDSDDNRMGYGVGTSYESDDLARLFALRLIADDDGRHGYSLEGGQEIGRYSHRAGGYYYDRDFEWLSETIQQDTLGVYYQTQYNGGRLRSNMLLDWSQRGVESDSDQTEVSYIGLGSNYRLWARDSIGLNGSYRYSDRQPRFGQATDFFDYRLNGLYSHQHLSEATSVYRATYAVIGRSAGNSGSDGSERSEISYALNWSQNTNQFGIELGFSREESENNVTEQPLVGGFWQSSFSSGAFVGAGLRYELSRASNQLDSDNWNGYVNAEWPLSEAWQLGLDVSLNEFGYSDEDNITEFSQPDLRTSSVIFSLRYQGSAGRPIRTLGVSHGAVGSGRVRGIVFFDENRDGIRQASEPGLPGVEVYLDRRFPAITNRQGEFDFELVASGSHGLYVAGETLPLPYVLGAQTQIPVEVSVRSSNYISIPVSAFQE